MISVFGFASFAMTSEKCAGIASAHPNAGNLGGPVNGGSSKIKEWE